MLFAHDDPHLQHTGIQVLFTTPYLFSRAHLICTFEQVLLVTLTSIDRTHPFFWQNFSLLWCKDHLTSSRSLSSQKSARMTWVFLLKSQAFVNLSFIYGMGIQFPFDWHLGCFWTFQYPFLAVFLAWLFSHFQNEDFHLPSHPKYAWIPQSYQRTACYCYWIRPIARFRLRLLAQNWLRALFAIFVSSLSTRLICKASQAPNQEASIDYLTTIVLLGNSAQFT